jgi:hypothetical protein
VRGTSGRRRSAAESFFDYKLNARGLCAGFFDRMLRSSGLLSIPDYSATAAVSFSPVLSVGAVAGSLK